MFGLLTWFREVTGDDRPTSDDGPALERVVNRVTAEVGRGVRRGEQEAAQSGFSVSVTEVEVTMSVDASAVTDDASSRGDGFDDDDLDGDDVAMQVDSGDGGKLTLTIVPDRDETQTPEQAPPTAGTDDASGVSTLSNAGREANEAAETRESAAEEATETIHETGGDVELPGRDVEKAFAERVRESKRDVNDVMEETEQDVADLFRAVEQEATDAEVDGNHDVSEAEQDTDSENAD